MSTSMRPEEIAGIIKERIANFETKLDVNEIGTVLTIGDGVARVFGLKNVLALTGDHHASGNMPNAKPVFDYDSTHLIALVREMVDNRSIEGIKFDVVDHVLFEAAIVWNFFSIGM